MATTSVAIAICTCGRPAGLRRLLSALADLNCSSDVCIVVVDNHPERAGLSVCAEVNGSYRWPLIAVWEPERGISEARNRASAVALDQSVQFVAWLDDDEWPDPAWLSELMRVQRETEADIVGAPVYPSFVEQPPEWVIRGGYCDPPDYPDGASVLVDRSGNFMIRAECLRMLGRTPFNAVFSQSGGGDTYFFRRLERIGCTMHWARFARAFETIPAHRVTMDWLRKRWSRYGSTAVQIEAMMNRDVPSRVRRVMLTAIFLARAIVLWLLAALQLRETKRSGVLIPYAWGRLLGHVGRLPDYYRH